MQRLDASNVAPYLQGKGMLGADEAVSVRELSGGVSNMVLLVERSAGKAWVVKQAREQLRTEQEWRCDVARVLREIDVLRLCTQVVRDDLECVQDEVVATLPELVFEDPENYCYAMTAAPPEHRTWKQRLLEGDLDPAIATAAGRLLACLHAGTWSSAEVEAEIGDRCYFEALRVDPYYRRIAQVHEPLRPEIELLIDSVVRHRQCLVHGDYSPKNLLVWDGRMMLIDFEVGHYGDPAFDLGFFLTHLVLKAIWATPNRGEYLHLAQTFWAAYKQIVKPDRAKSEWLSLEERAIANLAGCLLARVDGKSPVDYLTEQHRGQVRELAAHLFRSPPENVYGVLRIVE